jgi:hypothetical protein
MRDFLHAVPEGIFEATLVLCPSITMERLTLEDFMTLIRIERETWYTVSSSLVGGVGTLVISIKSDKDRDRRALSSNEEVSMRRHHPQISAR